jgi:RNA polymerase sigma-70 factor, ECF subfamily
MTKINPSDEKIVAKVVRGEVDSYGELMSRYEQKLLRYVIYLARDQISAADVVQDTFIKAYQNLRGFNDKYKFSSWIYRIAHNETMNAIKREKHINLNVDIETLEDSKESGVIHDIDESIMKQGLANCMKQLKPKYREVLMLQYFENMKYSEIADILQIPVSTVGVRSARAKTAIKQICIEKGVRYE